MSPDAILRCAQDLPSPTIHVPRPEILRCAQDDRRAGLFHGTLSFIRQENKNRPILDFDRIGHNILASGAAQNLSGADIELRAMPGTGQYFAIQFAFAQGAADMRAVVLKGAYLAFHLREAKFSTI